MVRHTSRLLAGCGAEQTRRSQTRPTHSLPVVHAAPVSFTHAPLPSQMFVHGGVPIGSFCPTGMGVHVPTVPGNSHAIHVPVHEVLQQTPSTQCSDPHSASMLHALPLAKSTEQTAAPSHLPRGHSSSGSVSAAMGPQDPSLPFPFFAALHAKHVVVQALLQQTPSTQYPEAQSDAPVQATPLGVF